MKLKRNKEETPIASKLKIKQVIFEGLRDRLALDFKTTPHEATRLLAN